MDGVRDEKLLDFVIKAPFQINNIELSYTQKDLIEFGLNVASEKMARDDIKQWLINHKK